MPAGPCTGALRRKLPTGHPSGAGRRGTCPLQVLETQGIGWWLPAACPTPRDHPAKSSGKVQGIGRNTGSPARWRGTRQPTAREGQVGPSRVAERAVLPGRPGNAGGGKGPQVKGWRKGAGSREWPTAYHPGDEQQFRTSAHAQAKGTTRAVAVIRASTGLMTHRPGRRKGASLVPRLVRPAR